MSHYILGLCTAYDAEENIIDFFEFELIDEEWLDLPWLHGVRFKNPPARSIKIRVDPEMDEGDFADYRSSPIPLVSQRLKDVLIASCVGNVEYYPTQLLDRDDFDDAPEYFAINVVGVAMTADTTQSKSELAFGRQGANLFERYVPDPSKYMGLDVFRVGESLATIAFSERIMNACVAADVATLEFTPLALLAG